MGVGLLQGKCFVAFIVHRHTIIDLGQVFFTIGKCNTSHESQYNAMEILPRPYPKFHLPTAAIQTVPHELNKLYMNYTTDIGDQNTAI